MYLLLKTIKITQIIVEKGIRGHAMQHVMQYIDMQQQTMKTSETITKTTIIICYVLRCKTSIWMGNILKSPLDHFK